MRYRSDATVGDLLTRGGVPLVSQHTLLIDPEVGENCRLDGSALEDVRVRIEYTYQDLFPAGQCE